MGSARGGYSIQFGPDVTKAFCRRTGVKSVIRSHQLPKRQRGFEITHNSMLLTIFSASNYGGVCRNRGGVLIFDEKGPAEVERLGLGVRGRGRGRPAEVERLGVGVRGRPV